MFGLLQNFEQAAGRFSPILLIALGVILLLAGLFIWLGGLGLARILSGAVGAVAGATCGFFVIRRNILSAAFLATVLATFAVIFQRIFFIILIVSLAVALCFVVLAWSYLGIPPHLSSTGYSAAATQGQVLNVTQTIKAIETYFVNISNEVKQICLRFPLLSWVIIAVIAVVSLYIAVSFWRQASAWSCATIGTSLIFTGMVLLLLYKGSFPISRICAKVPFYATIFLVMMFAGTLEQLLLCRRMQKRSKKRKKSDDDGDQTDKAKQPWRTI